MKNGLMEEGDVIIHLIEKEKTCQWLYCLKGSGKTDDSFEAGKIESLHSSSSFGTREEAIADLNKYVKVNNLKKANIIN
jgi:hypothetical protein